MESIIYQTASRLAQAIQGREVTSEEVVRAHLDHIEKHNPGCECRADPVAYARTLTKREGFIAQLQAFFDKVDFWLCPVAMTPAFPHCKPGTPLVVDERKVDYLTAAGAFAILFNMASHSALIIPLGQSSDGLPIGVQIVGPYWSEPELFYFAEHLAALTPGFHAPKGYADLRVGEPENR